MPTKTTRELIDDLALRQALLGIANEGTDLDKGGMNSLVAEAIANRPPAPTGVAPSSDPSKANVTFGGALGGVTVPVSPVSAVPAVEEEEKPETDYFYDLLLANDEYRRANSEAFERNEKASKARRRIAAVSDAISSLGNLVGTVYGAPNQEQTYQSPLLNEKRKEDIERARKLAQAIQENDQGIRLTKAKLDAQQAVYDSQLEKERLKYLNNLGLIAARGDETRKTEEAKHGYRTEENEQKGEIQKDLTGMRNESAEKRTAMSSGVSRANAVDRNQIARDRLDAQINGQIGSSGGVGGYTTQTTIQRDEFGRETGRTTTRTGSNGQTVTRTTGGTHGSQAAGGNGGAGGGAGGGSNTPPSRRKKDNSKKPPSRR